MLGGAQEAAEVEAEAQPAAAGPAVERRGQCLDRDLGMTLAIAASRGDLQEARHLLGVHKVNPNEEFGEERNTALHVCATAAVAMDLINRGANIHHRNLRGDTPLHSSCYTAGPSVQVIRVLLREKADVG